MSRRFCLVVGVGLSLSSIARANIDLGSYALTNQSGVGTRAAYGLKLHDLVDVTPGKADVFAFDFNAAGSSMLLDFDGANIRIHGVAFGGIKSPTGFDPAKSGFWNIDFTYQNVTSAPGDDDWIAQPGGRPNSGSIAYITDRKVNANPVGIFANAGTIALYDTTNATPFTFRVGDGDSLSTRSPAQTSGWGWLSQHNGAANTPGSDWKFTLSPVPLPGAALLALVGLFSAGVIRAGTRNNRNP